jgi:luciferase family oxidoreductase group 1
LIPLSVPVSVLDLAPICAGGDARKALANSLDLARKVEAWGFSRFWLAEHHNMPGIASAATAVAIAHVAGGTKTIRVGAGGIMLPNHAPLIIAEQFGTLEALHPGRIDLGLGRAPGTDPLTARALRRTLMANEDGFPDDVLELLGYFQPAAPDSPARVRAIPGSGADVEVWILGSSLYGAQLAAALGLPYAFASHFAPAQLDAALTLYRERFRPSPRLAQPRVMIGAHVAAADSDEEAALLASSLEQAFVNLRTGRPSPLPAPRPGFGSSLLPEQRMLLNEVLSCAVVGGPAAVKRGIEALLARTGADELILTSQIWDHAARLRSYEIVAEVAGLQPGKRL